MPKRSFKDSSREGLLIELIVASGQAATQCAAMANRVTANRDEVTGWLS